MTQKYRGLAAVAVMVTLLFFAEVFLLLDRKTDSSSLRDRPTERSNRVILPSRPEEHHLPAAPPTVEPLQSPTESFQEDDNSALDRAWTACSAAGYSRTSFRNAVDLNREFLKKHAPSFALLIAKDSCMATAANNPGWSAQSCMECNRLIIEYLSK
jgi:hypothetical protein